MPSAQSIAARARCWRYTLASAAVSMADSFIVSSRSAGDGGRRRCRFAPRGLGQAERRQKLGHGSMRFARRRLVDDDVIGAQYRAPRLRARQPQRSRRRRGRSPHHHEWPADVVGLNFTICHAASASLAPPLARSDSGRARAVRAVIAAADAGSAHNRCFF